MSASPTACSLRRRPPLVCTSLKSLDSLRFLFHRDREARSHPMGSRRCQSRGLCRAQCVRRAKPGEARSMDSSTTALIGSSAFHGVLSFDVFLETTALVPFAVRGLGVVVLDHDEHARVEDCARPEFSCVGASWFLSVELDDAPRSVALQRFRGSREGERGVCECLRSAPNTRARCCVKPQAQRAVTVAPKARPPWPRTAPLAGTTGPQRPDQLREHRAPKPLKANTVFAT